MAVRRDFVKVTILLLWAISAPAVLFGQAKDETLADIRQELVFLHTEIQLLNRELSTTSAATVPSGSGTPLQRANLLEQELRRITGVVEQLQFRIERIVQDGTNRIGDLEFRLVELEGGDVSTLGQTSTLGGETANERVANNGSNNEGTGVELAASEQGDFDRGRVAVEDESFAAGLDLFDQFLVTYPGGPLTGEAHYWRAEALAGQGDWSNAARAFLESFSGSPKGVKAAKSLFRLGVSLAQLGQVQDACSTLQEVEFRYPTSEVVDETKAEMTALSCI